MFARHLDSITLERLRELIEANFTARDALYTAAESLEDDDQTRVCVRLADSLAGHAVELQQIVAAAGRQPPGPQDSWSGARQEFEQAKAACGCTGVLAIAERTERDLKQGYDRALQTTSDREAEGVLDRHRSDVEFAEQVLRCIAGVRAPLPIPRRNAK
jgi:uncharacterized protein (TIGR02284 family)